MKYRNTATRVAAVRDTLRGFTLSIAAQSSENTASSSMSGTRLG